MAVVSIATLKTYFQTGDFPTESQFVDLIDTLNNASTSEYTKYVAILNQSGTDAPVATVITDTIGTITFSYDSVGNYRINSTAKFTANKTLVFIGPPTQDTDAGIFLLEWSTSSILNLRSEDSDGAGTFPFANGKLVNTPIEIRVYP